MSTHPFDFSRLAVYCYALAGACFAILLSGNIDAAFCKANPNTAFLLAAGVTAPLAGALAAEIDFPRSRWFIQQFCCLLGMLIALVGITTFFATVDGRLVTGFLAGSAAFLMVWLRANKPKHREFEESVMRDIEAIRANRDNEKLQA